MALLKDYFTAIYRKIFGIPFLVTFNSLLDTQYLNRYLECAYFKAFFSLIPSG